MSDYIDNLALKLEEKIEGTMFAAEHDPDYAWLYGKLLLLSTRLSNHHWKYRQAVFNGRQRQVQQHAHAIVGLEREYHKLLRPPGALDIDISVGTR